MTSQLGKLETADPRKLWANESADFTPWLARPENIAELGEALGIELEVENTEVAVGPYSADILARDVASDTYVVIENQLGKTDHDHLGKALTYAATLGATAVVWIATNYAGASQGARLAQRQHSGGVLVLRGVRRAVEDRRFPTSGSVQRADPSAGRCPRARPPRSGG
jgi:hypothetical protein